MNQDQIKQLNEAVEAVKTRKIENVYFVACGGSKAIFDPAQFIFDRETTLPSFVYNANEFIHRCPKGLGENSLVVTCSHSGNTLETTRATQLAGDKGALTISFSYRVDSPLWKATQHPISYVWGPESNPGDNNNGMLYRLVFSILNVLQPNEKYERAIKACDNLGKVYEANKAKFAESAKAFGKKYKNNKLIYTMSSGPCYGVAYSFAICLLQEMQWIHSGTIHTGEFFHGPFEVTDANTPFVIQVSEGSTRELDERCLKFLHTYAKRIEVLDAKELGLSVIDPAVVDYFNHSLFNNVYPIYNHALAETRQHPLTTRRYMWKVAY